MDLQTGEYTRKLAAVMSADVKGYSRLMEADEVATISTLKRYRQVVDRRVKRYRGRVVDSPGDNILSEFGSVHDAVRCAFAVQREVAESNATLLPERRMEFRIGINVGDIIQEGDRIYGDGVNIAARIEGLAEGGGVCISASAFEHIRSKMAVRGEDIGEHKVKNISDPIRVYRLTETDGSLSAAKTDNTAAARFRDRKKTAIGITAAVLLVIAGLLLLLNREEAVPPTRTAPAPASDRSASMAAPGKKGSEPPAPVAISFEDIRNDTGIWVATEDHPDIRLSIAGENASHGFFALKVYLPGGAYPGIISHRMPHDWRGFGWFRFEVFLSGTDGHRETLGIRIDDSKSDSFYTRYNSSAPLHEGMNRVEVPLEQVAAAIDIEDVRRVVLFLDNPSGPNTLSFDHIRLE
jgi:class 3 adenylate cyclase